MEIEVGKKTPMKVEVHHTSAQLLAIHEELANSHREYEQKVNYFKSKVKTEIDQRQFNSLSSGIDLMMKASLGSRNK